MQNTTFKTTLWIHRGPFMINRVFRNVMMLKLFQLKYFANYIQRSVREKLFAHLQAWFPQVLVTTRIPSSRRMFELILRAASIELLFLSHPI